MKYFLSALLQVLALINFAQKTPSEALQIIEQAQSKLSIFIHTDKDYYFKGEKLWFKAYLLEKTFPTAEAQNLIVRLIAEDGVLIDEKKYPILGATAPGNFFIPDSLKGTTVSLQAFTPAISHNPDLWFIKKYSIIHKGSILQNQINIKDTATSKDTITLRFFPEGGHLIPRVKNNIAFEALDKYGMPADISFKILNGNGEELKRIRSLHNGMGTFDWQPTGINDFKIQLVAPANTELIYNFPSTNGEGVGVILNNNKSVINFIFSKASNNNLLDSVYLLIHQDMSVLKYLPYSFDDYTTIEGGVNLTNIPSGLVHFTLFNKLHIPIAERIVFVNNNDLFTSVTMSSAINTTKRAENKIKIIVPHLKQATASLAVTDANAAQKSSNNDNIFSYLLLSKYIRGYIHEPQFYFGDSVNIIKAKELDLVLLTHGFKKYNWVKAMNGVAEEKGKIDNQFITLSGNVFQKDLKKKLTGGAVNAIFKYSDGETTFESTSVNHIGEFILDSIIARGKTEILFSYVNAYGETENADIKVVTDSLNYWSTSTDWIIDSITKEMIQLPNAALSNIINNAAYVYKEANWTNGKVMKMESVTVIAKKSKTKTPKDEIETRYTRGAFTTQARRVIDLVNTPHPNKILSLWDYIKTYLPVDAYGFNASMSVKSRTMFSLQTGVKYDCDVFLDEVLLEQGSGLQILNNIPIDDVGLIKYWGNGFIGSAGNAPGGALAIYTKSPQDRNKIGLSPLNKYSFEGYDIVEEFYSPDYAIKDKRHSYTDSRTTLFWTPNIITDGQNQTVEINFYNNDFSKKLRIVLQGVTLDGKLFYKEKIVE